MIVRYTERARRHLRQIDDYIAERDPSAAERVLDRIAKAVERLEDFPRSSRRGDVEGTFELTVPKLPYIVVYRVVQENVDILGVFHTARDPSVRNRT